MPHIVIPTTITSFLCNFCLNKNADINRIKIGAVYWSTIALAAVVSLLAKTKNMQDVESPIPAPKEYLLKFTGVLVTNIYPPRINAAITLRTPQISSGFQEISLIKIPPRLHIMAHRAIKSMEFLFALVVVVMSLVLLRTVIIILTQKQNCIIIYA